MPAINVNMYIRVTRPLYSVDSGETTRIIKQNYNSITNPPITNNPNATHYIKTSAISGGMDIHYAETDVHDNENNFIIYIPKDSTINQFWVWNSVANDWQVANFTYYTDNDIQSAIANGDPINGFVIDRNSNSEYNLYRYYYIDANGEGVNSSYVLSFQIGSVLVE